MVSLRLGVLLLLGLIRGVEGLCENCLTRVSLTVVPSVCDCLRQRVPRLMGIFGR